MSDCYICGKNDSHTYDCPKLNSSPPRAEPELLGKSYILKPIVTFKIKDKTWRIDVIKPGDIIPSWTTHAWYIGLDNKSATLEERALMWENYHRDHQDGSAPHTLKYKSLVAGDKYPEYKSWDLIVFGPL